MALRDHIIKQLVTALQQKKAEIKALRDQQAVLQRQLEAAEGEGAASKQKLRELAEGIQVGERCSSHSATYSLRCNTHYTQRVEAVHALPHPKQHT